MVGLGSSEAASTALRVWNMELGPTGSEPLARSRGCLSLADISSSLAEFAAPHDTTTMSPRKTSRCPATLATTSVTAVPLALVSSLIALALRSSVTLGNSSAGRTAMVSASDLACTRHGKPSQVWQRMQVLYAMFCSSSITAQGAGKG